MKNLHSLWGDNLWGFLHLNLLFPLCLGWLLGVSSYPNQFCQGFRDGIAGRKLSFSADFSKSETSIDSIIREHFITKLKALSKSEERGWLILLTFELIDLILWFIELLNIASSERGFRIGLSFCRRIALLYGFFAGLMLLLVNLLISQNCGPWPLSLSFDLLWRRLKAYSSARCIWGIPPSIYIMTRLRQV